MDVVLSCVGGVPTSPGSPVPQARFQIFLSTNATSQILNPVNNATEVMLTIGEPAPADQNICPSVTGSGCGLTGAVSGGTGIDYGHPGNTAVNGSQTVYNVYQGASVVLNSLLWVAVPFDPPGPLGTRTLRFSNLRVDASLVWLGGPPPPTVTAAVTVVSSIPIPIANSNPTVAFLRTSPSAELRDATNSTPLGPDGAMFLQCVGNNEALAANPASTDYPQGRSFVVRLGEGFAVAFKRRNAPWTSADVQPLPLAQANLPVACDTETGFYNPAFPVSDNHPERAGKPSQGTRFFIRFHAAPVGVTVFAPLYELGKDATNSRVRLITGTDEPGAGSFNAALFTTPIEGKMRPMTPYSGYVQAIYEYTGINGSSIDPPESIDLPFVVAYRSSPPPATATVQMTTGFAPISSDLSPLSPVLPRFADTSAPVTAFRIEPGTLHLVHIQTWPSAAGTLKVDGGSPLPVFSGSMCHGTNHSVEAINNAGYHFQYFSGPWTSTDNPKMFTVNAPLNIVANFSELAAKMVLNGVTKTGPVNARQWTLKLKNVGTDTANALRVSSMTVVHSAGPVCTPVLVTSLPIPLGSLPVGGIANALVTINFTGCSAASKFTATIGLGWVNAVTGHPGSVLLPPLLYQSR